MDLTVEAFNNRSCEILQGVKDLESIYQKLLIKKRDELVKKLKKQVEDLREDVKSKKELLKDLEKKNGVFQVELPNSEVDKNTNQVDEKVIPEKNPPKETIKSAPEAAKVQNSSKVAKNPKKKKTPASTASNLQTPVDISRLDLRVGKIINVKKHPDADSLYVEDIDVGEEKPRNVVTGVARFIPIEQMQDRMVVALCNLKPSKLRGIVSQAMVMCASTDEAVEIISPPEGALPGDRIVVSGFNGSPDSQINPKKKILEQVFPDLKTDDSCVACYKGLPLSVVTKGACKSQTLANVRVK